MENKEWREWGNFIGSFMIPISFVALILADSDPARLLIAIIGIFSFITMKTCEPIREVNERGNGK